MEKTCTAGQSDSWFDIDTAFDLAWLAFCLCLFGGAFFKALSM